MKRPQAPEPADTIAGRHGPEQPTARTAPPEGDGADAAHQLEVRERQIEAVHQVTQRLFSTLALDDRLRDALSVSMRAVDATAGSIYLYRPGDDTLVFQYVVGPPNSDALIGKALPAHQGIAGEVFNSRQTVLDNSPRASAAHRRDIGEAVGFITESMVTVPLKKLDGDPVGVMQILNKASGGFDDDDIEVLEIVAAIAATAIENAELQRDAQLAAVARAVGNLSHDIKNKVAPVSMVAHILGPDLDRMFGDIDAIAERLEPDVRASITAAIAQVREEYAEHCDILHDQVRAVQEHTKLIADALKNIQTKPQFEICELAPLIREQVNELVPVARERGISITTELADMPAMRLDRFFIRNAVYNLINNAIPETPSGGRIIVRASIRDAGGMTTDKGVCIEVEDNGNGMPAHVLERLLRGEANSTKPGGTGLGTKIVYNAVRAHGGFLEGTSVEGKGTTIGMRFPLVVA